MDYNKDLEYTETMANLDKVEVCNMIYKVMTEQKYEPEESITLKFLYDNNLVDDKCNITEKGIKELYH